jgi:hypothetical protein
MSVRTVVMLTLLIAVVACLALAAVVIGAPAELTRPPVGVLKMPDLVVQKVVLVSGGSGDFPTGTVEVTVKNKGEGRSAACLVGGIHSQNMTHPQSAVQVNTAQVGGLESGATGKVTLSFVNVGQPWRAMLIVCVDGPVPGKANGQVTETNERNNFFGTSFDVTGKPYPVVLKGAGGD